MDRYRKNSSKIFCNYQSLSFIQSIFVPIISFISKSNYMY